MLPSDEHSHEHSIFLKEKELWYEKLTYIWWGAHCTASSWWLPSFVRSNTSLAWADISFSLSLYVQSSCHDNAAEDPINEIPYLISVLSTDPLTSCGWLSRVQKSPSLSLLISCHVYLSPYLPAMKDVLFCADIDVTDIRWYIVCASSKRSLKVLWSDESGRYTYRIYVSV